MEPNEFIELMTFTRKGTPIKPLSVIEINGNFVVAIYKGEKSPADILIRYRQKLKNGGWSRIRTPKHIHWTVDILIKTEDLDKSKQIAEKIQVLLEERFPEVTEPLVDIKDGLPQVEILIDRDKLYTFGLNIYSVGQEIKASIDGIAASRYRDGGSEYDILIILDDEDRNELPDLDKIFVMNIILKKKKELFVFH